MLEPSRLRRLLDDELQLADGVDRLAAGVASLSARVAASGRRGCRALSTVALVICFAVPGTVRGLFAFVWVALALGAMALEWTARRRA